MILYPDVQNMVEDIAEDYSLDEIQELGITFLSKIPLYINSSKPRNRSQKYINRQINRRSSLIARRYINDIAVFHPSPTNLLILVIVYNLKKSDIVLSPFKVHGIFKNIRNRGGINNN
jgi:hypothetical protein